MTITETTYNCATAELTVGMTLPWGETVVALRKMGDYRLCEDGGYNYHLWYAVCVREGKIGRTSVRHKNFHDYAVRIISALPHGWQAGDGDYFHNIYDALNKIGMGQ